MDMNNALEIVKDILSYWCSQILEKAFYFVVILIIALLCVYCSNPYGRYLDAWLY